MFRESGDAVRVSRSGLKLVPSHGMTEGTDGCGFGHTALLYADLDEYLAGTSQFLCEGDAAGDALMVAIPGERITPLRETLGLAADRIRFVDMRELGRNPARIIPKVRNWAELQPASRYRFIGEPIWPGRDESEVVEATRHEALINLAFADLELSALCPYDVNGLEPGVLEDAERTHPNVLRGADSRASDHYTDPVEIWLASQWALPEPRETMATMVLSEDLTAVRQVTEGCARAAGLSGPGVLDLVLAVDEAATNAVVHGLPPAELRIWREAAGIVCEITDHGHLDDPLAGRRFPAPDWTAGRGLWLINQLCDLVELRSVAGGTAIRMHAHTGR
jgi:anti-sigma regulatory factor (Ser/Thr protein kinase)